MAKNSKNQLKKSKVWLANKIKLIRQVSQPITAKISSWGGPAGIALIFFLIILACFYPSSEAQTLKQQLLKNPQDLKTQLRLTEFFLTNHQFTEAEKMLLLMEGNQKNNSQVLVLRQQKNLSDPEDIKKLITFWEKIVAEKPNYRDAYLQLAVLQYKVWQNEKAEKYLKKALIVDPNFEASLQLKQLISSLP
jgi:thioredoxin-like negative regulator of GroEL